jgi:small subunit ribosomal protein S11
MAKKSNVKKKKEKRIVKHAVVHIQSTFNNTIVSISDTDGAVLAWASSGGCGFKGGKKSTPYAAQIVAKNAAEKSREFGIEMVDVYVKGPGSGRESAIRSLQTTGFRVRSIKDVTPIPHNGCRPPKRRRV